MRKLLLVLALLTSTTAFADNWKLVIDSADGTTRLLVNTDSVRVDKYKKPDGTVGAQVFALMEILDGRQENLFAAAIDADECLGKQQGGVLINMYKDKTSSTYFWSMEGSKLYDAQGQWLCGYLSGTLEQYQKNKSNAKPKVTM